jgi:hypothetical protein
MSVRRGQSMTCCGALALTLQVELQRLHEALFTHVRKTAYQIHGQASIAHEHHDPEPSRRHFKSMPKVHTRIFFGVAKSLSLAISILHFSVCTRPPPPNFHILPLPPVLLFYVLVLVRTSTSMMHIAATPIRGRADARRLP